MDFYREENKIYLWDGNVPRMVTEHKTINQAKRDSRDRQKRGDKFVRTPKSVVVLS